MGNHAASPASPAGALTLESRLAEGLDPPPEVVLVASDLHMGEGRDPVTGNYARSESFFAGEAFARWLAFHGADAARGALLILNGDTFDFLRIVRVPVTDDDYRAWCRRLSERPERAAPGSVDRHERVFGLRTDDYKAVWKLHVMFTGHPDVFDALARWLRAGGRVLLIKGNHDLELHWAEVLRALRAELGARVRRLGGDPAVTERMVVARDSFVLENLYLEHGHRYEALTQVVGPAELPHRPGQLTLPLGSFINRYLINGIESADPLLDNVRPVMQSLLALIRRHPGRVWTLYWRAWRFVGRAFRVWLAQLRAGRRPTPILPVLPMLLGLAAPHLVVTVIAVSLVRPALAGWIPRAARVGGSALGLLAAVVLPCVIGALREMGRRIGLLPAGHQRFDTAARSVLREWFGDAPAYPVVYAVMGHTHEQGVRRLGDRTLYVNAGTWIALWPDDRRELAGRVLYSYIRFTRGGAAGYRHELLVWDDQAGAPRGAQLMDA